MIASYPRYNVAISDADPVCLDPHNFSGSVPKCFGPDPSLKNATNLTGTENVTTYACSLAPSGPTDKENQVKIYKRYCMVPYRFRYIMAPLRNGKDPDP